MALKAHSKHLAAVDEQLVTAAPWRPARSLEQLLAEANAAAPGRNKASDGMLGDARHQAENGPHGPGSGSDHNPWVIVDGRGVVRAEDLTNDPSLDLPAVFERLRAAAAAGRLPQVLGGGYAILAGRITTEDWSGWAIYKGPDPHVSHGHVSVSLEAARFDSTAGWGVFTSSEQPAPPPPPPPPPPAPAGRDLTGRGDGLRGDVGATGPRVAAVQGFLRRFAPAYAGQLAVDGVWGPRTTAALAEFAHRSGIAEADGRNIGPKIAAALHRAGFDTAAAAPPPPPAAAPPEPAPSAPVSARDRVRGHLNRRPGR
jgi:hypothetical protein